MGEQQPRFKPGENVPAFATTALVGGTCVKISAAKNADGAYQIAAADAKGKCFGVTEYDAGPTTQSTHSVQRQVNVVRRGAICRVRVGTVAIVAGEEVEIAAGGVVVPLGTVEKGNAIGRACHTGPKEGIVEVDLY